MADPIRVVVVDDSDDLRQTLRAQLAADDRFDLVGEAADGSSAVDVVDATRPDVLLLDVSMPHVDGVTALHELHRRQPGLAVVVYAADTRRLAVGEGIAAVVRKGTPIGEVLDVLAAAAQ